MYRASVWPWGLDTISKILSIRKKSWTLSKPNSCALQNALLREWKDKSRTRRKYLKFVYLTNKLQPE